MNGWRLAALWVVALAATSALTWQIVSTADGQVNDRPAAIVAAPTTSGSGDTSTSSTSTTAPAPTTSLASSSSTEPTSGSTPTTSAGVTTSSSAPTTNASAWTLRTINSAGGTVVVRYRPGEVELQSATPSPGYVLEIDDAGPPKVRVEFESAGNDVRIEAEWQNGQLVIQQS